MANIPRKNTNHINPLAKELRYFMTCAEKKNISRAAELLDVQQAGLSKIILKLEAQIGETLFYRSSKGLMLTEFGESLYASLQKTNSFWLEQAHESPTILKLGCHPSIAANIYHRVYPTLLKEFPKIELETEFLTSLEVTQKISRLEIDLGFVINPIKNPELVTKKLERQHVGLWSKKNSDSSTILYNPQMYLAPRLQKKFKDYTLVPLKDYEVIGNVVQNSNLLGMLPNHVAERYGLIAQGNPLYYVEMGMIWHREKFKHPKRRQILTALFQELET